MARALVTVLLASFLTPGPLVCQAPQPPPLAGGSPAKSQGSGPVSPPLSGAAGQANPSAAAEPGSIPGTVPGPRKILGNAAALEGGVLPGARVWVTPLADPRQHLGETQADSRAEFTLELREGTDLSGLILKASTQSGLEGCELLDLVPIAGDTRVRLLLRKPGENYDEPSLDAADVWLVERLARLRRSRQDSKSKLQEAKISKPRRPAAPWEQLVDVMSVLRRSPTPEMQLRAAISLMRVGAWNSAGTVLAAVSEPQTVREKAVLEGVRLNFLRRPEEAKRILAQALGDEQEDSLPQLELGRAAVMAEDWPTALQRLDPVLRNKRLAPYGHYLRARSLLALGDLEGAAQEANVLTQKVKRKRLPGPVQSFVADVRGRLEERSIQAVQSIITQPVAELVKAVPNLASLDTSIPPAGQELSAILQRVGANIEKFFRDFSTTAALEVIRQARLDSKGKSNSVRRVEMYYVFLQKKIKGQPLLEEYRGTGDGRLLQIGGLEDGYMVTSGFASSLVVFHPFFQSGMEYRYLGRQEMAGRPVHVVGFAQRPEASRGIGIFRSTHRKGTAVVYVQGVAWISADQFQVLRLRTDLLQPLKDVELHRQTSEIDYRPYHFMASPKTFFLPSRVTVSIQWGRRRLRNEHIFSRFWLFDVEIESEDPRAVSRAAEAARPGGSQ